MLIVTINLANDEIANDMAKSFEIANTNIYRSSLYRYK